MTVKKLVMYFVLFNIIYTFIMSYYQVDIILIDVLFYYLIISTLIQKYYYDNNRNLTSKETKSVMLFMSLFVISINILLIFLATWYTRDKTVLIPSFIMFLLVQIGHLVIINTIIYTSNKKYEQKGKDKLEESR